MRRFLTLILLLLSAGTASAAPAEVRGINFDLKDSISKIKLISDSGFNTIYFDFVDEPLFGQAVIEAHRNGLFVIARVNFPIYVASDKDPLTLEHRDWFPRQPLRGGAWLNPFHADVQKSVIDQAIKITQSFDVDGIQLSMQMPGSRQVGYDTDTLSLYSAETKREVSEQAGDEEFTRWRIEKISDFALRFVTELRGVHPDLILSTEVDRPSSEAGKLTDWISWTKWCECGGKHWDEIAVRYPDSKPESKSSPLWKDDIAELNTTQKMFLTIDVSGADFGSADYKLELNDLRTAGIAGHYFRSGGMIILPDEDDGFQIISQYQVERLGPAHNPLKPANWREPSISATREGDVFVADLKEGNRYHVIVKKDGLWNDIGSFDLKPGRNTFLQDGDELELLVDRRP